MKKFKKYADWLIVETVCVNEKALAGFLDTTYLSSLKEVTLTRAMSILAIPRNRIIQLGKLGYLNELVSKTKIHSYSDESIATFLDNYICIERWAEQHGACSCKVIKSLKQQNIAPELPPFIYAKANRLERALQSCFSYDAETQEQLDLFDL